MKREEKSLVIKKLTAQLTANTNIYLADISGLNAGATSNLRRACFKANVTLEVVKNTLLEKAMIDRKSVVQGKSVDLGGRRIIKKKNKTTIH